MSKLRQIVAMGGGGFAMESHNPRMDRYILSLAKKRSPRICYLPTASGDKPDLVRRFHAAFKKYNCRPSHLTLFQINVPDPPAHLLSQDIIYVNGGNTANMLAVWRLHGIDKTLRQAWHSGIILAGFSAGMICWFANSITDSFGPLRELNDGLALLPFSACPHYRAQPLRRPTYLKLIKEKKLPEVFAADDGAAIHFVDKKVHRCVASRRNASVYQISLLNGRIVEKPLPTILLPTNGKISDSHSHAV